MFLRSSRVFHSAFLISTCVLIAFPHSARSQEPPKSPAPSAQAASGDVKKLMDELRSAGAKYKWNPILWFDEGWKAEKVSRSGRPLIYYVCGKASGNTSLI